MPSSASKAMSSAVSNQPVSSEILSQAVPSLRSSFRWTFVGNTIYAACQWGMLSVLAKAGSPAIVGQFALGLAIAAPVFMFTNLQLRAVQATDARSEFEFADYFTLRVLASAIGLLIVAAIAWFLHYDPATRLVVLLVGVSKTVESLSDVVAGLLQKRERLDQIAISLIIRGALSLAAFGVAFLSTHNPAAAVAALIMVWGGVFLLYDVPCALAAHGKRERFFRSRATELGNLFVVSVPLGVVMTLISLNTNIPRYVLVKYLGEADLGVFAAMAYMLVALNLVVNALGQSATARLARMFAAGDIPGFRAMMRKFVLFGVLILLIGPPLAALFGRPLLTALYRPEYGQKVSVFTMMIVTAGLNAIGSFLGYGATAARSFQMQVPVVGLATLAAAAFSFVLVPKFGLMGAAEALLISALVLVLGYALSLRYALARSEAC
jgi:O-antigen/teichoic acid export membrane protein